MRQGTTWQDQWARIDRWRERVRLSRDEFRNDGLSTEGYRDEVFALFQAIWHLRDWLHNDAAAPVDGRAITAWIGSNGTLLTVAHDIANGSKHMELTSGGWVKGSTQTRNSAHIHAGRGVQHVFYIQDNLHDKEYEAVDLADKCMAEWSALLTQHGLSPSTS